MADQDSACGRQFGDLSQCDSRLSRDLELLMKRKDVFLQRPEANSSLMSVGDLARWTWKKLNAKHILKVPLVCLSCP